MANERRMTRVWRAALVSGACAVVFGLWAGFYVWPRAGALGAARDEIRAASLEYKSLVEAVQNLPRAETALAETRSALEAALAELPSEAGLPDLARRLADRARAADLRVREAGFDLEAMFRPSVRGTPVSWTRVPYRMVVVGTYGQIGRFLETVAGSEPAVEWEAVTIERSLTAPGLTQGTLRMVLYARAGAPTVEGAE